MSTNLDLAALEARILRIEDLEAIKQLKARYCAICDDDHNPTQITTVFTEDGIWEGPGIGKAEGHAGIRELFERFQATMSSRSPAFVHRYSAPSGARKAW